MKARMILQIKIKRISFKELQRSSANDMLYAANHYRGNLFFQKVFHILQHYKIQIKQTFSNLEIFDISLNNKKIFFYLFENETIAIYKDILHNKRYT